MPMPARDPVLRKLSDDFGKGKRSPDWQKEVEQILASAATVTRVTVEMPQYDWGTSQAYYPNGKAKLHYWLEEELRQYPEHNQELKDLAEIIHRQAEGCEAVIYEYSQRGQSFWAAGECPSGRGFICSSSDNGQSWVRQWFSEKTGPDPVYGIYFTDSREGWALTFTGILHTSNKGVSWERMLVCDNSLGFHPGNLFILENNKLIVSETKLGFYLYSSEDRGLSWNKIRVNEENKQIWRQKLDGLKARFGGRSVHYGGIYSYEGTDKE